MVPPPDISPNGALRLRLDKGLSREELAFKAGVSMRTIERLENGTTVPRRATLKVIADVLGVDAADLLPSPTQEAA